MLDLWRTQANDRRRQIGAENGEQAGGQGAKRLLPIGSQIAEKKLARTRYAIQNSLNLRNKFIHSALPGSIVWFESQHWWNAFAAVTMLEFVATSAGAGIVAAGFCKQRLPLPIFGLRTAA